MEFTQLKSSLLRDDHNKPHSLMSNPTSMKFPPNMSYDLSNKILFKPNSPKIKSICIML